MSVGSYKPIVSPVLPAQAAAGQIMINTGGLTGAQWIPLQSSNGMTSGAQPTYSYSYGAQSTYYRHDVITLHTADNKKILSVDKDGNVIWEAGFGEDEAAKAFARSLNLGAEQAAGIKHSAKQRMRDVVFEEMISMAKAKGSLTAEDLTFLHQSAKIMDKLRGIE